MSKYLNILIHFTESINPQMYPGTISMYREFRYNVIEMRQK